jgi:hypothetical protein
MHSKLCSDAVCRSGWTIGYVVFTPGASLLLLMVDSAPLLLDSGVSPLCSTLSRGLIAVVATE